MDSFAWHIMMRLRRDAVIAPSPEHRRAVARVFHRKGRGFGLLAFSVADTHLHSLVCCGREAAGEFARRVEISLHHHIPLHTGFSPAHLVPVRDQHHLERTFHYIHKQQQRHGLRNDPLHEGSSLSDLLGLRAGFPGVGRVLGERLPRVNEEQLWSQLELGLVETGAMGQENLLAIGLAATGGRAEHQRDLALARAGVIQAVWGQYSPTELAVGLECGKSAVFRLRSRRVPAGLLDAVHRQFKVRALLDQRRVEAA